MFREVDADSQSEQLKLIVPPLPDKLRKLATNALWEIKHAADHAVRAACDLVGGGEPGKVYFPVGSHPANLAERVQNNPRYPAPLHELLEGFQIYPRGNSYPGGNDEFCALSKLANSTKHAVSLVAMPEVHLSSIRMEGKVGGARFYPRPIKSGEFEYTLGTLPHDPDVKMDIEVTMFVAFGDVPALVGIPAGDVLQEFGRQVDLAVCLLESEAFRLRGGMG